MKKALIFVLLFLSVFALTGCTIFGYNVEKITTTTTTVRDTSARELLYTIIDDFNGVFGTTDYEDFDYEENQSNEPYFAGAGVFLFGDKTPNEVVILVGDAPIIAYIDIFIEDDGNSLHTAVWEIDIAYTNIDLKIYAEVWYCYQGGLLHDYMDNYNVDMPYLAFVELMATLTLEDVQWLYAQLGFDVNATPEAQVTN